MPMQTQQNPSPAVSQSSVSRVLLALDRIGLWHTVSNEAYATIGCNKNVRVNSREFQLFIERIAHENHQEPLSSHQLDRVVRRMAAKALYDGPEHTAFVRVAGHDRCVFIDLANQSGEVVQITEDGWRVTTDCPVKFVQPNTMRPLPSPVEDGSIDDLRPLVNARSDTQFELMVGWLLGVIMPRGPYPILILNGEQGSAKTTTTRVLRRIIDPCDASVRPPIRDERDLRAAVANGWLVAYDNVSRLSESIADTLCRLATGIALTSRQLYTDFDEVGFTACRPLIINGIPDLAHRPDLLDRSIVLTLPEVSPAERRIEAELWDNFDRVHPSILGALCNAVVKALQPCSGNDQEDLPRMADWDRWVSAAEIGLGWQSGTIRRAFDQASHDARQNLLSNNMLAAILQDMVSNTGELVGTASHLLSMINDYVGQSRHLYQRIPRTPAGLSAEIRRIAPALRDAGYFVEFARTAQARQIRIGLQDRVSHVQPRLTEMTL